MSSLFTSAFVMLVSKETFFCFALEKWYELPSFPNPNKWGYSMVSLNNDIYVTGESHIWPAWKLRIFRKLEKDTVTQLTFLPGGSRGPNTNSWSTTETWKYVTREERWTTVAPMIRPRTNHASTTLNGEIYVIGGQELLQHVQTVFSSLSKKHTSEILSCSLFTS